MNTKTLANHYSTLTAEERFRPIHNADSRCNSAEGDQMANAGERILKRLSVVPSGKETN